jgi:16S rRNA (guanine527-N7)-methyltransferase
VAEVLERARAAGFLGPGPIEEHWRHSLAFADAWSHRTCAPGSLRGTHGTGPSQVLDLGSGGGLPGLVLATAWPASQLTLLDSNERRTRFLTEAVRQLGWSDRVEIVRARAEEAGRTSLRSGFDLVVSRSFGPPAVTAECGRPFLELGGVLAVAEPPGGAPDRWPPSGLEQLGLQLDRLFNGPPTIQLLLAVTALGQRFPRRTGLPGKRPLWL